MLGDAAGLAGHDIGAADRVEQRGLAVVDMAHDGHHRRARLQRFGRVHVRFALDVDIGFGDAIDAVAEFLDQQLGGVLVDRLGDRDGRSHLEQRLDEVGAALAHALGELLDGDRFGNVDVAILLGGRAGLLMGALFLLAGAAKRGEAAGAAVVFAGEGAGNGQLAGMAAFVVAAAGTAGLGALGRMGRGGCGFTEAAFLLGFLGHGRGGGLGRLFGGAALGLGGLLGRLACGFFLGLAIFLGAALLVFGLRDLDAVLAAARFLERGHARFVGLAQQALLHFLARGDVVDRALGARAWARARRAWAPVRRPRPWARARQALRPACPGCAAS